MKYEKRYRQATIKLSRRYRKEQVELWYTKGNGLAYWRNAIYPEDVGRVPSLGDSMY